MTDLKITFELPINIKKDTLQVVYDYLDNLKHFEHGKAKHNVFKNFSRPSSSKKSDDGYSYSAINLEFVDINFLDMEGIKEFQIEIENNIKILIIDILEKELKSPLFPDYNVICECPYLWIQFILK